MHVRGADWVQAAFSILCGTVTPCLLLCAARSQLVRCPFCVNVWTARSVPLTCLGGIFVLVRTLFLPRDTFSSPLLCTSLGFGGGGRGDSGRAVELPAVISPSGKVISLQMLIREQTEARDY